MIRQFFNVLYRRILYKIPLKLLLVILAIVSVFIACTQAEDVSSLIEEIDSNSQLTVNASQYRVLLTLTSSDRGVYCIRTHSIDSTSSIRYGRSNSTSSFNEGTWLQVYSAWISNYGDNITCFYTDNTYILAFNPNSNNGSINYDIFRLDNLLAEALPLMSSSQCQTEYNLIPISSVDSSYCTTNNLCPSLECPFGSGSISTLYINDILHVGSPFIYLNIPQEIGWDYTYTQGGTNMLIEVEGYNVDYEKIDNIVNTQTYTPNESDLSSIITDIVPLFVPGLVIILFLYFLFRFIKKIF